MFTVYAVRIISGEKHRHVLQSFDTLPEAKHLANCATLGNADYAYVKDSTGGTVFYLKAPVSPYEESDLDPLRCRPKDLEAAKTPSHKYHP